MDPENAVEIDGLTKTFRFETKTGPNGFLGMKKTVSTENAVLDNISLKIKRGDVVGSGSTGQEAEGGRGGHGMIVPRPETDGYAQVQGSAGPVGSVRVGPCVSPSSSWCSP